MAGIRQYRPNDYGVELNITDLLAKETLEQEHTTDWLIVNGNSILGEDKATDQHEVVGRWLVNTDVIYVDEDTDHIGIGTATPSASYKLDIEGNVLVNVDSANAFLIEQIGVHDDTLVVDTHNGYVGVNKETPTVPFDAVGAASFSSTVNIEGQTNIADNLVFDGVNRQIQSTSVDLIITTLVGNDIVLTPAGVVDVSASNLEFSGAGNIGQAAANRPGHIYVSTDVVVAGELTIAVNSITTATGAIDLTPATNVDITANNLLFGGAGNIGAAGATRPTHIYALTDVVVAGELTVAANSITAATGDVELTPAGNVNITANSLEMAGTVFVDTSRNVSAADLVTAGAGGAIANMVINTKGEGAVDGRFVELDGYAPPAGASYKMFHVSGDLATASAADEFLNAFDGSCTLMTGGAGSVAVFSATATLQTGVTGGAVGYAATLINQDSNTDLIAGYLVQTNGDDDTTSNGIGFAFMGTATVGVDPAVHFRSGIDFGAGYTLTGGTLSPYLTDCLVIDGAVIRGSVINFGQVTAGSIGEDALDFDNANITDYAIDLTGATTINGGTDTVAIEMSGFGIEADNWGITGTGVLTCTSVPIIGTPQQENKLGSDCTGADGAANRTFTLAATPKTSSLKVTVGAVTLYPTLDYTLVDDVVTLLGNIWDADNILLDYWA